MCIYKDLRYGPGTSRDSTLTWNKVDAWLRKAIKKYSKIRKRRQPIFIDLIIKITICRAYVNNKNKKLLTTEKVL